MNDIRCDLYNGTKRLTSGTLILQVPIYVHVRVDHKLKNGSPKDTSPSSHSYSIGCKTCILLCFFLGFTLPLANYFVSRWYRVISDEHDYENTKDTPKYLHVHVSEWSGPLAS